MITPRTLSFGNPGAGTSPCTPPVAPFLTWLPSPSPS